MKILLQLILVCVYSASLAQEATIELTHEQTQDPKSFVKISNGTKLSKYTSLNGTILKIGDTLIIGTPDGNISSTDKAGVSFTTKTRPSFTTISMGRTPRLGGILLTKGGENNVHLSSAMIGQIVRIADMEVYHRGSRKKPLVVSVLLGEPNGRAFGIYKYLSVVDFENSLLVGEIKSKNTPLTSDEALAELKKAKDKLDLELISLEEYTEIKDRLKVYIK